MADGGRPLVEHEPDHDLLVGPLRMFDPNHPVIAIRRLAPDPEIAAGVDAATRPLHQRQCDPVDEGALGDSPEIEPDPRRQGDRGRGSVDPDPGHPRSRGGGIRRWDLAGLGTAADLCDIAVVPGRGQLGQDGRIEPASCTVIGRRGGLQHPEELGRDDGRGTGGGVQAGELTLRPEAAEAVFPTFREADREAESALQLGLVDADPGDLDRRSHGPEARQCAGWESRQ